MVLRGSIRGGGAALASYLLAKGQNDRVEIFDIKGTSQPDDLKKSLIEMSLTSELSGKTKKGVYHGIINPQPGSDRTMTKAQWLRASEIIEEELKLVGQKRIMVLHEKNNRLHMHVAWERYNHETRLIICNRHSQYDLKRCRLKMEREFGHEQTSEVNQERPSLRLLLADLWQQQPTGKAFLEAVEEKGYRIAAQKGRRPYVIVNAKGRTFELIKEIPGVKTRQVRERLRGLKLPDKLMAIDEIKEQKRSKPKNRKQLAEQIKQDLLRETGKSKDRGR